MIPPLFINNKLKSDFKLKANFLNKFFADKCTPIQNNSVIFNDESILKILRAYYGNKVHSHDDISVRMIKLCDKSIIPAISLVYKNCINPGIFPNIMLSRFLRRVIMVIRVVDNYRPVSLLPIFGKILIFFLLFS